MSNKVQKKLAKSQFRSPLQKTSEVEKAKKINHLPAVGQTTQQGEPSPNQQKPTESGDQPKALDQRVRGPLSITAASQGQAPATAPSHQPFKVPGKLQHGAIGKENKEVTPPGGVSGAELKLASAVARYYACLYSARYSGKKKPSLQDGVLQVADTKCCLYSQEGKVVGRTTAKSCTDMPEGATLEVGTWELEVFERLPASVFLDGSCFLGTCNNPAVPTATVVPKPTIPKAFKKGIRKKAKNDTKSNEAQGTVCRYAFDETSTVLDNQDVDGKTYVVVIDPYVAAKLRPHQKEGVRFMYRCVMGLQTPSSSGCLLADEMGLGKTLQTLTLIWTLLKQGQLGKAAIRRAVVICPSSLVENWGFEVKKWLGNERLRALAIHAGTTASEAKAKFDDFINGNVWPLLITSYELARKYSSKIAEAKCGLLICDEAHRLKNSAGNKTIEALLALKCRRRVLLSGTPLQNNLSEYFAMMSFIAPDLLGSLPTFKRLYADPIERGRDRTATEEEKLLGEARSAELQKRTQLFVLRRTSEVNAKYLPPRTEYVVFCKLQPFQVELYEALLQSQVVSSLLIAGTATTAHSVLATIGLLRKLCNHPHLLSPHRTRGSIEEQEFAKLDGPASSNLPPEVLALLDSGPREPFSSSELSGKLAALMAILQTVAEQNAASGDKDKVVVVSEWTATLDVIQEECTRQAWHCARLDGATAVADRQSMVNRFNSGHGDETIFLLSKKAGGCGLNLIGAHRLVLFDADWNPANDKQAMARIWRDGQTKPVVIYRLLSRGTIEEKIYQRQIAKDEVAAEVTGASATNKSSTNQRHFSREELKELFTLRTDTACDTRDLVQGSASGNHSWEDASPQVSDGPLKAAISSGYTTFVRQEYDQNAPGIQDEGNSSGSMGQLQQTAVQDTIALKEQRKPELLQSSEAPGTGGRPRKRRKKIVVSDSEPEDCGDEKEFFEELDEEDN